MRLLANASLTPCGIIGRATGSPHMTRSSSESPCSFTSPSSPRGHGDPHGSTLACGADDVQVASQEYRPLLHAQHALPHGVVKPVRDTSVVADEQRDAIDFRTQMNFYARSVAVHANVVQ